MKHKASVSTFKDLQTRMEEAERVAQEATAKVDAAERLVREIKDKAEVYIREARTQIADSNQKVLIAERLAQGAQEAARPFLHERDEWWQKVFLTALSATPSDGTPQARVDHAAAVASASLLTRSGFHQGVRSSIAADCA